MTKAKLLFGFLCLFLLFPVQAQEKEKNSLPTKIELMSTQDTLELRRMLNERKEKGKELTPQEKKDFLIYRAYSSSEARRLRSNTEIAALAFWLQQTEGLNISLKDIESCKLLSSYVISPDRASRLFLYIHSARVQIAEKRKQEQENLQKEKERKTAELREQDSLRHLMETGNYDYKKWVFNTSYRISIKEDGDGETVSWINVSPRVDYISNSIGEGSTVVLVLLSLLIAILLTWLMSKKVFPPASKEEGMFFLLIYIVFMQSIALYYMLASLYSNIDELIIRKTGQEYVAKYDYNGFNFVTADSIAVAISEGECTFDRSYSEDGIPVRYDAETMKLAVDVEKYTLQNWNWILFVCLLLLLDFLLCYGKLNSIMKKVFRIRKTNNESPYQNYVYFPWNFKNKKYETFEQFKDELEHYRLEWDLEDEYHEIYETPRILIRYNVVQYNEKTIEGSANFEIEILPDNGKSISLDEWMYKFQNALVPYMDQLDKMGHLDTANIWIYKGWEPGKEMRCNLSMYSSLDDDIVMADVVWEFTNTDYPDYRAFIKEAMAFQTEHGKHFWNPDTVVIEQPSFALSYYNPQTKNMEMHDLEADNGIEFTEGEVLYKLHQHLRNVLSDQEYCYFQYLIFGCRMADTPEEEELERKDKDIYDLFTTNDI